MVGRFQRMDFCATMMVKRNVCRKFNGIEWMTTQKLEAPYETLSKRAIDILRLLDQGLSDREIAERLVMTINTIKWYNRQIYDILDVGSRTQAIARGRELGLLEERSGNIRPAPSIKSV